MGTPLVDAYAYEVKFSEEDGEHVGLCAEFPSLSFLAESEQAAIAGIREVVAELAEDMRRSGETLPAPVRSP